MALFGALAIAAAMGLKYSQATLLFGLVAVVCAPVVLHRIPNKNSALGMLVGLSIFASFPLKKLFQVDGFVGDVSVSLVYGAVLWVVGFGWKRNWR